MHVKYIIFFYFQRVLLHYLPFRLRRECFICSLQYIYVILLLNLCFHNIWLIKDYLYKYLFIILLVFCDFFPFRLSQHLCSTLGYSFNTLIFQYISIVYALCFHLLHISKSKLSSYSKWLIFLTK